MKSLKSKTKVTTIDIRLFFKKKTGHLMYFNAFKNVWDFIFDEHVRKDDEIVVIYNKKEAVKMRLVEFLIHLIIWRPNIVFNVPIKHDDFYIIHPLSRETINFILNKIIKKFIDIIGEATPLFSETISYIIENFGKLAESYSTISSNTISLYDIIQFQKRNKTFAKLLYTTLDESKTIKELEDHIQSSRKKLLSVIIKDKKNSLYPFVESSRINSSQLTQMLVAVGPRPDIDKTIIPKPIVSGFIHGFKDMSEYYIDSVTARDALLTKYNNVSLSGYLSRKINILCLDTNIDYNIKDCGTKHHLSFFVENDMFLNMVVGKYMIKDNGDLYEITKTDRDLIGKTIKLRSHVTCAHPEQDKICPTCYGSSSKMLIGTRIGGLPSIKIANPMSQKSMSAKHLTGTDSVEITNEYINKYFYNDGSDLYIRKEYSDSRKLFIIVDKDDLEELLYSMINMDDTSIDTTFPLNSITIRDGNDEFVIENEGMMLTLSEEIITDKKLFIDDENDPDKITLPIRRIDPEVPIFSMILTTEEISKYLNMFISITDRNVLNKYDNYNDLMHDIVQIMHESGIFVRLTHFETVLYNMIRDIENVVNRPDFKKKDVKYQLLKVSQAIEKKDVYTALVFQGIKRQFKDESSHAKKRKGIFDPFFKTSPLYPI